MPLGTCKHVAMPGVLSGSTCTVARLNLGAVSARHLAVVEASEQRSCLRLVRQMELGRKAYEVVRVRSSMPDR